MSQVFSRSIVAALAAALLAGCGVPQAPVAQAPAPVSSVQVQQPTAASKAPVPASPVASPAPSETLAATPAVKIKSVANFRDVAGSGAGLVLSDGTRMATGVVYRSAKLKPLSSADKKKLVAVGITDIYDLRTPTVVKASPDPKLKGAIWHASNVYAVKSSPVVRPSSVAKAEAHMKGLNKAFVSNAKQRKAIGAVLRGIAGDKGPVIVHCTEGKDRTGWISAMLQLVAGATEKSVVSEYLLSNTYRKKLIDAEVAHVKKTKGAKAASIKKALLRVDDSYLKAGLSELKKRYGDLDGYLTDGLGLSHTTIVELRAKLRVAD